MNLNALNLYGVPNGYMLASSTEMSLSAALYTSTSSYPNNYKARSMI